MREFLHKGQIQDEKSNLSKYSLKATMKLEVWKDLRASGYMNWNITQVAIISTKEQFILPFQTQSYTCGKPLS